MSSPRKSSSRDFGLPGGSGKGDAPRHKLDDNYRANYDAIDWGRPRRKFPLPCGCDEACYCSSCNPELFFRTELEEEAAKQPAGIRPPNVHPCGCEIFETCPTCPTCPTCRSWPQPQ